MQNDYMAEIAEFLAKAAPSGRSPCAKYEAEITYMLEQRRATQKQVLEWLALPPRGVKITAPDLSRWLARQRARKLKAVDANLPLVKRTVPAKLGHDLDRFLEASPPGRRAPYTKYQAEIIALLGAGATQKQVLEWFSLPPRNLVVTASNLSGWLTRRRKIGTQDVQDGSNNRFELELPSETEPAAARIAETPIAVRAPDERSSIISQWELLLEESRAESASKNLDLTAAVAASHKEQEEAAEKKGNKKRA